MVARVAFKLLLLAKTNTLAARNNKNNREKQFIQFAAEKNCENFYCVSWRWLHLENIIQFHSLLSAQQ